MRARVWVPVVAVVLLGLMAMTIWGMIDPSDDLPPAPAASPTTTAVDGLSTHLIELDGQTLRCVIYYHGGVDCWPIHPTPTPQPQRSR
jgi:hypothetical protein